MSSSEPAATGIIRGQSPRMSFASLRRSTLFYPLVGLVVVCLIMIFASDSFLSVNNLSNVGRQVSINALIAVGMTFVILTGGIDLSVGSVMALSGTLAAGLMIGGVNAVLALVVCLVVGVAFGIFNGAMVAYGRMPPIIVTLATMGIARGLALIYTHGYPITIVVYAVAWLVLERMPIGRYVYAIGGNESATRLSGVRVGRFKMIVYAVSGLTSAIAGVVITARLMSGQPNAGVGFELDAIAAVVLGGTAISGGRGSIIGTLLGALLLGVLNNGLNMVHVDPYVQNVIKGGIILLAIYIGRDQR
jgi:ribose transport system permease protein